MKLSVKSWMQLKNGKHWQNDQVLRKANKNILLMFLNGKCPYNEESASCEKGKLKVEELIAMFDRKRTKSKKEWHCKL